MGVVLARKGLVLAGIRVGWISVALVGLLTGCASHALSQPATHAASSVPSPAVSSPSAPPPSAADLARQQATAAYLGMWHDMAAAATTSDWQSPQISQHATGDALLVISKSLYTDHLNGVVTKGQPKNNPQVSSVDPLADPTTVMISDCGDSSNWLKYRLDGQLVDNAPGGRRSITAEVQKQPDGSWKVTRFAVLGVGSC